MFTGIIDHIGTIATLNPSAKSLRVQIHTNFYNLVLGESISVDGICLTVNEIKDQVFYCDISPETLQLTTAAHFRAGQKVNLERALRPSDRLGGHFVLGHVDKTLSVKSRQDQNEYVVFSFGDIAISERPLLVNKGSIAVNGVSLTINTVDENTFQVMLVPHTLQHTNLQYLQVGNLVNIEFDYLAKIVKNITSLKLPQNWDDQD